MPTQLLVIIKNGKIEPLEPIDFPEGTKLIITMNSSSEIVRDPESEYWYALSLQRLSRAYGADEPDYELSQIKEFNPSYQNQF